MANFAVKPYKHLIINALSQNHQKCRIFLIFSAEEDFGENTASFQRLFVKIFNLKTCALPKKVQILKQNKNKNKKCGI